MLLAALPLALLACDGSTAAAPDAAPADAPAPPPPPPFAPQAARLRRLTRSQYANTVRDLFGESVVVPRALEPDTSREGSRAVGATETSLSPRGTEQYQDAAYAVAEQVLRDPARRAPLVACSPAAPDDADCAATFVRAAGRRAWRRPLADAEVAALVAVAQRAGRALQDFHRGLEYALAAMLQAPDFLFRAELGDADPTRPGERRYRGYELASRLAYFLWDGPPDDALLDAAGRGELDSAGGLAASVDRMLASPKAGRGLRAFVDDWLDLEALERLSKDATAFPSFSADFGASAREEVLRDAEHLAFEGDADFRDLLTSRETFVNRRLAALYGVQFPLREAPVTAFARVTLPSSQPRRGFLGTAAFLALAAHPVSSSPTLRGRFIRERLLCYEIAMPPVNVNTAIPEPSPSLRSLRQRLSAHVANASCRGCHGFIDPPGLAFEHFDGVGRYRRADNGVAIDASGDLDGRPYRDAAELAAVLREHPHFPECVASRLYRHAWGHVDEVPQREEIVRLTARFAAGGYRLRALLREIALGDAFGRAADAATGGAP